MKIAAKVERFALVLSLTLALFSSGLVIAHQCHSALSASQNAQVHLDHDQNSTFNTSTFPTSNVSNHSKKMVEGGCAVLLILILFLGRKYLLPTIRRTSLLYESVEELKTIFANLFQAPKTNFSRAQLGVFRI